MGNDVDEFSVIINKQDMDDLGLDILLGSASLEVAGIRDGPVAEWNKMCPKMQVMVGHFIVEVNGVRGSARQLQDAIREAAYLKIVIASDTPSEKGADDSEDGQR